VAARCGRPVSWVIRTWDAGMGRYCLATIIALIAIGGLPSGLKVYLPTDGLIIGDSIIHQMRPFQQRMPYPLSDAQNHGVSGETSYMIAERLRNLLNPSIRYIFIEGGVNDFMFGLDNCIVNNYRSMIDPIRDDVTLYLIGILPVHDPSLIRDFRDKISSAKIEKIDNDLRGLCGKRINCHWMHNVQLMDVSGLTIDGLHLNYRGYRALAHAMSFTIPGKLMP
jgi:lysophospholipase L1-like esterase